MSDLIDRQAVIDAIMDTEPVVFDVKSLEPHQKTKDVINAIENLPSAQPEQKKGKWIKDRDGIYHCSCCGTDYLMYELAVKDTHYCPNCGCRMEEGDSE